MSGGTFDMKVMKKCNKVELLVETLIEKENELGYLKTIIQTFVVWEHQRNDELQDAWKELVNVSYITIFNNMKLILFFSLYCLF